MTQEDWTSEDARTSVTRPRMFPGSVTVDWIFMGYHVFKRWPMDIYRILCATWVWHFYRNGTRILCGTWGSWNVVMLALDWVIWHPASENRLNFHEITLELTYSNVILRWFITILSCCLGLVMLTFLTNQRVHSDWMGRLAIRNILHFFYSVNFLFSEFLEFVF